VSDNDRYRIRALERALSILQVLNQYNGLNASELSRIVSLPRPTVVRFLNTLMECGYVNRSPTDECYRVAPEVRQLTFGYREEPWLTTVVRPYLENLQKEMVWPLAFLCLHKERLVVEALTDRISPMVDRRDSAGAEVPFLSSASGFLLIALADEPEKTALTEHALKNEKAIMKNYGLTEDAVRAKIEEAALNGYAMLDIQKHVAVSVPVWVNGKPFGALNLRIKALKTGESRRISSYVKALFGAAEELGRMIGESINGSSVASYRGSSDFVENAPRLV
jgi:IclR family mhp operon transcriptional activator